MTKQGDFPKLTRMSFIKAFVYVIGLAVLMSCSKVGYVPLSDVSIDQEVQKNHRETKKFLRKDVRAQNSQLPPSDKFQQKGIRAKNSKLPKGDKFLVKGLRKNPSRLPKGEKLHIVKKQVSTSQKKKYKHPKKSGGD